MRFLVLTIAAVCGLVAVAMGSFVAVGFWQTAQLRPLERADYETMAILAVTVLGCLWTAWRISRSDIAGSRRASGRSTPRNLPPSTDRA